MKPVNRNIFLLSKPPYLYLRVALLVILLVFNLSACAQPVVTAIPPLPQPTAIIQLLTTPETHPFKSLIEPIRAWNVGDQGVRWVEIGFDDLAPGNVILQQCWNGMGMDDQGRIYIGFTSQRTTGGEDFVVFRYDPASGVKAFLGTFVEVAKAAGNLETGENIPKGHTRLIYADGKMYMGSQGFHDLKWEIDDLPKYRGAHIFAFDTLTNAWQDLAAGLSDGVILPNQGIVALGIMRDQHLLVGLAHPYSDIVLFDYQSNQVKTVIPGIPWKYGNPLSREVIIAPSGRIYTYRGTEDPRQRKEKHPVWMYDPQSGKMINTGFEMTQGFWIGQTQTRDGSKIYVSTTNGQLYEFDTASETFTDLGYLLPAEEVAAGRRITYMYGVTLSPDEKMLYYIPTLLENPEGSGEMFAYDLETGQVRFVQQFRQGVYTAADLRDDENIYLAHFGSSDNLWSDRVRLMIIHLPEQE